MRRFAGLGLVSLSSGALCAALALTACGPTLAPSSSFGELSAGEYDYRAATPRGVAIAARAERNAPRADVDFWSRAEIGRASCRERV